MLTKTKYQQGRNIDKDEILTRKKYRQSRNIDKYEISKIWKYGQVRNIDTNKLSKNIVPFNTSDKTDQMWTIITL